jgi:hypothetical protein
LSRVPVGQKGECGGGEIESKVRKGSMVRKDGKEGKEGRCGR